MRRRALVVGSLGALALALVVGVTPGRERPLARARGVVLICVDCLRADRVSSYGAGRPTTPTIDALAAAGVRFEDAVAQSSWTVPATASLLTGLYPSEHGAGLEGQVRSLNESTPTKLRPETTSLAQELERAGFRTAMFSANPYLYGRFKRGFEVAEVGRRDAGAVTDEALAWLDGLAGERFFLYLHYIDLHHPVEPPPPYFDCFPVAEGGRRGPEHQGWEFTRQADLTAPDFVRYRAHKLALFDGATSYVDDQIGRLLGRLGELGLESQTLVVVTADHGEEFWDHAEVERRLGGDPRGIWGVGHGHSMFQELLRVPLVLSGPGVGPGLVVGRPVRQIDVAPTLLDLLGLPRVAAMSGESLAPLLEPGAAGGAGAVPAQVAESPAYGPDSQAVISGRYKLIVRADGVELLFDLAADPGETRDLRAAEGGRAGELRALLRREIGQAQPVAPSEPTEIDRDTAEQLRALGYLTP